MKIITVSVTETATYERRYLVNDDFDITTDEAEDLFLEDADAVTAGFVSVSDRVVCSRVVDTDVNEPESTAYDVDYAS